jgi:magnesium transporter
VATREGVVTAAAAVSERAAPTRDEATVPCSYYWDAEGRFHRNLHPRDLVTALQQGTGALWVDIDSGNRHQHALLEKVFKFHPLAVEDTLNPDTRVKLEEYSGFLFLVMRGLGFCESTADPYDLETFDLYFFLGKNFLVTVHGERAPAIDAMSERLVRTPDALGRGVAWLMHSITDASVDAYFPIVDQIDEFVNGLEERVFVKFDQSALRDIFSVKSLVLRLRRHLAPQREVFNILTNRPTPLLTPDTQVYFRDVYDHVLRINESLETYRELLSSTLDSYLTQVSNRLGQITKALSVVATVSLPFVVVSGMWGMNFTNIPLQHSGHGFWTMLFIQVGLGAGLLALLKWRGLL